MDFIEQIIEDRQRTVLRKLSEGPRSDLRHWEKRSAIHALLRALPGQYVGCMECFQVKDDGMTPLSLCKEATGPPCQEYNASPH